MWGSPASAGPWRADPDRVWRPAELVAYVLGGEPLFPPGQGWSYADTNYILLGMIIEKCTGRTYYAELARRILKPFGLADTVPADRRRIPGLVCGYAGKRSPFRRPGRTLEKGRFVINPQLEWTGGGLASTARDLARWGDRFGRGKAFPRRLMAPFLAGVPARTGPGERYGLGVILRESPHGPVLGHTGWFPGYVAIMSHYQKQGLTVALQFNTSRNGGVVGRLRSYADRCAAILLDRR